MDDLKLYSQNEKELGSLVQTVRVFSEYIGMKFGIEKCVILVIEKGKIVKSVGIELPGGKVIKSLQESESYKYLGILEADEVDCVKGIYWKVKKSFEVKIEWWEFSS